MNSPPSHLSRRTQAQRIAVQSNYLFRTQSDCCSWLARTSISVSRGKSKSTSLVIPANRSFEAGAFENLKLGTSINFKTFELAFLKLRGIGDDHHQKKNILTIVALLNNVMRYSRNDDSSSYWYVEKLSHQQCSVKKTGKRGAVEKAPFGKNWLLKNQ